MTSKVHRLLEKWISQKLDIEKEYIYAKSPLMERINAQKAKKQSSNSGDARKDKG